VVLSLTPNPISIFNYRADDHLGRKYFKDGEDTRRSRTARPYIMLDSCDERVWVLSH
jgi:hypothetical protein